MDHGPGVSISVRIALGSVMVDMFCQDYEALRPNMIVNARMSNDNLAWNQAYSARKRP